MNNSFIKLAHRKDRYLFVDKTEFIYETNKRLNEDNCLLAVTRPRRFG
ncbi:MAG: AAA family ATPase, partial [Succinivibrionaceae bacterium]